MPENIPPVNSPPPTAQSPTRSKALRVGSIRSAQDDIPAHAVNRRTPDRVNLALDHARMAARIADDNRAKDILLLDLRQATPLLDFFVIATANSRRLSHAIASEIDAEMKKIGEHKLGLEGSEEGAGSSSTTAISWSIFSPRKTGLITPSRRSGATRPGSSGGPKIRATGLPGRRPRRRRARPASRAGILTRPAPDVGQAFQPDPSGWKA